MKYEYTLAEVNLSQLESEIKDSEIVTALDYIDFSSPSLDIYFKASLSSADETLLNNLVTAHEARPIISSQTFVTVNSMPAFASKVMESGESLFKRVHGIQSSLSAGTNTVKWTNPYPWVKFVAIEFFNAETLDTVDLKVLDSTTGTYTGVADSQLNQFGFQANLSKDYYKHQSEFDADLYENMQVELTIVSNSSKTIGINFIMNEVK